MPPKPTKKKDDAIPVRLDRADLTKAERILKQQDPNIFTDLKDNKKQAILRATATFLSFKSHQGPLPDSETMRAYAEIIPDGGNRVMKMAEEEQAFRHKLHSKVANRSLNQQSAGQIFGFILALVVIVGGIYLTIEGYETTGFIAMLVPLAGLAGVFIYNKRKKDD